MRAGGTAGAASIAAAMGRLDRLGSVPVVLEGAGALRGLIAEPLAGLVFERSDAALEHALASIGAPAADAPAADGAPPRVVSRALAGDPAMRAALRAAAAPAGPRVPRRPMVVERVTRLAAPSVPAEPAASRNGSPPPSGVAHDPPGPDGSTSAVRTPVRSLTRPAQLGASTPVGVPSPVQAGETRGTVASVPESGTAVAGAGSPAPSATAQAASTVAARTMPAESTAGLLGETASRAAEARGRVVGGGAPIRTEQASALERESGAAPAPVAGLSGLVSWWDARGATEVSDGAAAGLAETARPAATWSAVDHAEHEPSGRGFETFRAGDLSLRSALEELLLAEARASGIEVGP